MGDDEDVGPCMGFGTMCCAILFFFPASCYVTGWNEQTAVCREWAIDNGAKNSHILSCSSNTEDAKGKPIKGGDLGFLHCPVDQTTFKAFKETDISGFGGVKDLFGRDGVKAAAVSRTVSMWQCKEHCARSERRCSRRLEEAATGEIDDAIVPASPPSQERRLLSKRLPEGESRRLKKSKKKSESCHDVCVEWGYSKTLSSSKLSTSFNQPSNARVQCGTNYAVGSPSFGLGLQESQAPGGSVFAVGKKWSLNMFQLSKLPIDKPHSVTRSSANGRKDTSQPPSSLTSANTQVVGGKLTTCAGGSDIGCLVIEFKTAQPQKVTMLSGIKPGVGAYLRDFNGAYQMMPSGWKAPGYWVCSADADYNNINAFCPHRTEMDMHKGLLGCGEDVTTMEAMVANLKGASSTKTWALRLLGFLMFWFTVSSCLQPIRSVLGAMTNMMDSATDCIPCVGSMVDTATDIFMGAVKCILCIVSLCCGGACFLSVVVVIWCVMKPALGFVLAIVVCCCCYGGFMLLHQNRQSAKGAREPLVQQSGPQGSPEYEMSAGQPTADPYAAPSDPYAQPPGQMPMAQAMPVPAPTTMMVTCPAGSGPGDPIAVMSPSGVQVQVQVPDGISEGQNFMVQC